MLAAAKAASYRGDYDARLPYPHLSFVLHPSLCFFLSLTVRYRLPKVPLPTVCEVQPLPPLLHLNWPKNIHLQLLEW